MITGEDITTAYDNIVDSRARYRYVIAPPRSPRSCEREGVTRKPRAERAWGSRLCGGATLGDSCIRGYQLPVFYC